VPDYSKKYYEILMLNVCHLDYHIYC